MCEDCLHLKSKVTEIFHIIYRGVWAFQIYEDDRKGFPALPHPRLLLKKRKKQGGTRAHAQHFTVYRDLAPVGNDF